MSHKEESSKDLVPVSITSAQLSLSQEQSKRARKYFISMMIRTGCFILTLFLPSPYRWFTLIAAMILPYVAVVIANAGRETILSAPTFIASRKSLT